MMTRDQARAQLLRRHGWAGAEVVALPGDASFRRYARLRQDGQSLMLMDAAPPQEDIRPFAALAGHLKNQGFSAPAIIGHDQEAGFLLLEDFGDQSFTALLAANPAIELELYRRAVDLLAELSQLPAPASVAGLDGAYPIPDYDCAAMMREADLLPQWFLAAERPDYSARWSPLFAQVEADWRQDPILVLRDFHVDNLMWLPERPGTKAVGLLDFQDALIGHKAYDLVSLLQDARRDVPLDLEASMIDRFIAKAGIGDQARFRADYAILGAQRAAKIVGIFSRLAKRDQKPRYLAHLPRLWQLLARNFAHPALAEVAAWFDRHIPR